MNTLRKYFTELLTHSLKADDVQLDVLSFNYVVELLVEHSHADRLNPRPGIPTLFEKYNTALTSMGYMRFEAYRQLGDLALFLSGLFSDYVNSTGGLSYYIDMGQMAYRTASTLRQNAILCELSNKFSPVVSTLSSTSRESGLSRELNVDALFELYSKSPVKSNWAKLVARGAIPSISMLNLKQ